MNNIHINNKDYPFKMTLNALIKYEDEFDKSISEVGETMTINEIVALTFFGLEGGSKISETELDLSREELGDIASVQELQKFVEVAFKDIAGEGGDVPKKGKNLQK